jgi:hypothetical protein
MRQVTGFLTTSGVFYETKEEAEFKEAEAQLGAALETIKKNATVFFAIIEHYPKLVEEYVHARKAFRGPEVTEYYDPIVEEYPRAEYNDSHTGHDDTREGEASPVFALKADGREPVSAVGSGAQSEAVRDEREGDGFGGRRDDA